VTGGNGSVTEYASGGTTPIRTITKGVKTPLSLVLDRHGNLYVGNYFGKRVTEYAPGSSSPMRTIDIGKVPTAMVFDHKGNLYVAGYGKEGVREYAPDGSTPVRTITKGIDYPQSLAIDSADHLTVANHGTMYVAGTVTMYATTGNTLLTIKTGIVSPLTVAFAPVITISPSTQASRARTTVR
jgi:hypothetical protein